MRHHHDFHDTPRRGRYRPEHAWLGSPGDGPTIRARPTPRQRWRFGWRQARILLLALALGLFAWLQLPHARAPAPVAGTQPLR